MATIPKKQLYNSKGESFVPVIDEIDPTVGDLRDKVNLLWGEKYKDELTITGAFFSASTGGSIRNLFYKTAGSIVGEKAYLRATIKAKTWGNTSGTMAQVDMNKNNLTVSVDSVAITDKSKTTLNGYYKLTDNSGNEYVIDENSSNKSKTVAVTNGTLNATNTVTATFIHPTYYGYLPYKDAANSNVSSVAAVQTAIAAATINEASETIADNNASGYLIKGRKAYTTTSIPTNKFKYDGYIVIAVPTENTKSVKKIEEESDAVYDSVDNPDGFNSFNITINTVSYKCLVSKTPSFLSSNSVGYTFSF